jgi:hypothetical protein
LCCRLCSTQTQNYLDFWLICSVICYFIWTMDTLKNAYRSCIDCCNRVVQWRSGATVPYIFAVNTAFWYVLLFRLFKVSLILRIIVYYATTDTQMKSLAALAFIIFCNDVLFAPTHDRSILLQVLMWPIRDFWKVIIGYFITHLWINEWNELKKFRHLLLFYVEEEFISWVKVIRKKLFGALILQWYSFWSVLFIGTMK